MAIPRASPRAADDVPLASPVSESSTDARSRFIVRPLLSSAAVTHAVRARMRRPDAVDVVLGKRDQLVLVVATDDGRRSRVRHAQHLHGTLTDLRALPSDGAAVDLLAALSDSGNLSIVRFDDALSRFLPVRQLRLGPPGLARDLGRLVVDPRERRLALTRPGAAHVTVFHPVPGGAPGDFESAGTPVEYSGHVAMDSTFAPRAPDASALVVLVASSRAKDSDAKEGSGTETRDAVDANDSVEVAMENIDRAADENVERVAAENVDEDRRVGDDSEPRKRRDESSRRERFPTRVDAYLGDVRRGSALRRSPPDVSVSLVEHADALGPRARLVEPPPRDAALRDARFFFFVAGERVFVVVSARANWNAPVVRAIRNPEFQAPTRWIWIPETKTRSGTRRASPPTAPRSSPPSAWRLFAATESETARGDGGGARVGAPIVVDAATGDAVEGDVVSRPTGVREVTAMLPAPLSDAPRGVVVFGRFGSAATVWTDARDVAASRARNPADATAFLLGAGVDANADAEECDFDDPSYVPTTRTPPLAPVDRLARLDDATSRGPSAAMIAGGTACRLTRGVATTATVVSPPAFGDVTAMWALGADAIALSLADATRVFVSRESRGFEEAIDGAGLATDEPTVACGAWRSGNVATSWTQVTPRRARLCADGTRLSEWRPERGAGRVGAAVVSSSGRAAASLPARGVVVLLRRVGDRLVETARVLVDAEPSCLELPPPRVAAALVRAMRSRKRDETESFDESSEDWCLLLSGTYARALEVTAIRQTDSGSDSGSKSAPLLRVSVALEDDAGAPASIRVSARDETRPAVLVTTRTGELALMEPRRRAPDASLALPSEPSPAPPKPPRLLSGDALRARLDADPGPREIETILVDAEGISSRRGPSPLELALADAPERGDVAPMAIESPDEAIEDVENVVGERDASPRPRPVAVPLRVVAVRRLCDGPLDLVSLGDAFLARGHRESWVVRDALGTQRVSVDRADAPEMSAACAMPANPNVALAVVRGRLAVVRPDLEQRDPARRAPIADPAVVDEFVEEDERVTFLCGDDATGRVVATTERGVARDWRTNEWGCLPNEGSRAPWSLVSWKRAADSDADHAGYADSASSDVHVASSNAEADFSAVSGSSVVSNAEFYRVTALASCEPPAEVDGGVLAVGTSNPTPFARFRRMEGGGDREDDLEGHVFLMHLADEDEAVDAENAEEAKETRGARERVSVAATVHLPRPVTCVAAGPFGTVIVASGRETHVVRVEANRFKIDGWAATQGAVVASLVATHASRRPVLAVAASPPSRENDDASSRVSFALAVASRRDGVILARVDAPSREPDGWRDARVAHVAADATTRDATALAMRRRGEVAGIDAEGRVFVLQNRNDPRGQRQKREREANEGGDGSRERRFGEVSTGGSGREPGPSSPERRLVVAASFTIRAIPSAMTTSTASTASTTAHPTSTTDRPTTDATTFDPSDETFGPALIVGTREGGAAEMREISAADWATLREVQSRMETHRLLASVLGASHAHARGSWPSRAGFCRSEAPPPPLADATELASSAPPPPEVIDGYLLAELVDLPEEAQRAVLSGDAEGDAEGFARAPLPLEATMELVVRVMEAL